MGWFAGVVFACCAASLVVRSNVEFDWKNARLFNTHITNETVPAFPRRDLPFLNDTRTSGTVPTTSSASTSTPYFTSKSEGSTTSTVIVSGRTSSQESDITASPSAADKGTSVSGSNNVPVNTSTRNESSRVSPTTTAVQQPTALSPISSISPRQTSTSSHTFSGSSGTASSIHIPSTVKGLPVVSDTRSTASNPIFSTTWMNADPSRVSNTQPLIEISSSFISLQKTPSTSLQQPVGITKLQQSTRSSVSSPMLSATTIAGLPQHSVLSLTSWLQSGNPEITTGSSSAAITPFATPISAIPVSQTTSLSGSESSEASAYSMILGPSLSSTPTSEAKNETNPAIGTKSVQSSSSQVDNSASDSGGSITISASAALSDILLSRSSSLTNTIIATDFTALVASVTPMSLQATELAAYPAAESRTISSPVALSTMSLGMNDLSSTSTNTSSPSTVDTSSFSSPISGSLIQTIIFSTTSHIMSTPSPFQSARIPTAPVESDRNITVTSTTALRAATTSSLTWRHPSLSASLVGSGNISLPSVTQTYTSTGSAAATEPTIISYATRPDNMPMISGIESVSSTTSAVSSISTKTSPSISISSTDISKSATVSPISTFVTKTRTQSWSSSDDVHTGSIRTQSAVRTPTSSPTEAAIAAAPPQLTPSQTAGVAIGSTAGVLLAIVAAIFVARRYHAMHAAKHESWGSSGVYPKVAYLYDPSLGENGGRDSEDDETLAFMSGGATGLPSTGSRTPPRAPQNSFDFESCNWHYNSPSSPFRDPQDPFLDWRSSDAINSPSETAFALAAAVAEYGAGPQKPLPPVPHSLTPLFRDHVIPSPTLSPMVNGCSLRRSHARSSRGSSVRSQRSLRSLRAGPPSSLGSTDHPPGLNGPQRSLSSINEGSVKEPSADAIEHDLLLPVDLQTETPDSVIVYAPVPRSPMRPALSTILSDDQASTASLPSIAAARYLAGAQPRSTGSILFPTSKNDQCSYASFVYNNSLPPSHPDRPSSEQTITHGRYSLFPPCPFTQSNSTPRNKGWEEIKRTSNSTSSLHSSFPTPPVHSFAPPQPNFSPPPAIKKRSLIQLRRKTPLFGTGQPMVSSRDTYTASSSTPFAVKTSLMFNSNKGLEGPRMSLLAKVNSMSDMTDETASPKKRKGMGLGYRDSVSRRVEMRSRWSPSEVGKSS